MRRRRTIGAFILLLAGLFSGSGHAGQASIAVAANFTTAAKEIAEAFQAETGHEAVLSFGSTGQLYTQIAQGAPFEVFLAADTARPARALEEGLGVDGSDFTYAIGTIVLWSADPALVKDGTTLKDGAIDRIAIANPETAPYGAAAVEAMRALGVYGALKEKIVQGNNIAQAFQFVETGNALLGFVAGAQVAAAGTGSSWHVPADLYTPIRQDAVLLAPGANNAAAQAFLDFLKGPAAAAVIAKYGYAAESGI